MIPEGDYDYDEARENELARQQVRELAAVGKAELADGMRLLQIEQKLKRR